MIKTKRAFVYSGRTNPVEAAINKGAIRIRLNESLPALGNCSLDGNPGEGDLRSAENFGAQLNGYVLWDSDSIRDEKDRWEVVLWIDGSSYYPTCVVDLTPRRCRAFKPAAGRKFTWTNTLLPPAAADSPAGQGRKAVQTGQATADRYGLVTAEQIQLTKGKHLIVFRAGP